MLHAVTHRRALGRCGLVLATLALAVACESSGSDDPTPALTPTPATTPTAPETATEGSTPAAAGSVCDLLTEDQVAGFLGGDIISATDRPASGEVLLGGCEWIATNSTSLRVDLRNLEDWDEGTSGLDWEQVGDDPNARFSDTVGLAYRASELAAYILVRVGPSQDIQAHIGALQMFLGA